MLMLFTTIPVGCTAITVAQRLATGLDELLRLIPLGLGDAEGAAAAQDDERDDEHHGDDGEGDDQGGGHRTHGGAT